MLECAVVLCFHVHNVHGDPRAKWDRFPRLSKSCKTATRRSGNLHISVHIYIYGSISVHVHMRTPTHISHAKIIAAKAEQNSLRVVLEEKDIELRQVRGIRVI